MSTAKIEITFSGTTDLVPVLREFIRTRMPLPLTAIEAEEPRWVLVSHWHDSGGIQAVYGPYTKERAEWLHAEMNGPSDAWTVTELKQEPES